MDVIDGKCIVFIRELFPKVTPLKNTWRVCSWSQERSSTSVQNAAALNQREHTTAGKTNIRLFFCFFCYLYVATFYTFSPVEVLLKRQARFLALKIVHLCPFYTLFLTLFAKISLLYLFVVACKWLVLWLADAFCIWNNAAKYSIGPGPWYVNMGCHIFTWSQFWCHNLY